MQLLYENKNIPQELELYINENSVLQKYFKKNFDGVQLNNYCGSLVFRDQHYFIIPKIADDKNMNLDIFIYMILYAYDIKFSNEDLSISANIKYNIFELFINFFSKMLLNELKKGVYKKYIFKEENLKVLKGKYLYEKNFTNFFHQNIFCEYDEFSIDNEMNQFFLYAIKTFQKFSSSKNLYTCEMIFDEVSYKQINIATLNIHFDRLNTRYKKSYDLALMLLKKLIPLSSTNQEQSFAFLFDMAEVFEKFIANIYKSIDSSTQIQVQRNFGNLQLKPDIITSDFIIDTKYKLYNTRDDLKTFDKYQMYVYGLNFKRQNTMLLYPKHLLDISEDLKLGNDENMIDLQVRNIDLNSDKEFDGYINEIKKRVREII